MGRIQDFKLGGGALIKIAPSGGRREKFLGISCEKSRFYAKKSYFFQLRREAGNFWGISCEKSPFYAGFYAGCPPLGSAPAYFGCFRYKVKIPIKENMYSTKTHSCIKI